MARSASTRSAIPDAIREISLIAALPVLLALHQFDEAFVWLGLEGHVPRGVEHVVLWIYLVVAFVVLPLDVPLAVMGYEVTVRRKLAMTPFAAIGLAVSVVLCRALITGPFDVVMHPYHLSYGLKFGHAGFIVALYVIAVCGAMLASGSRPIVTFGLVNLVVVLVIVRSDDRRLRLGVVRLGRGLEWRDCAQPPSAGSRPLRGRDRPGPDPVPERTG